MDTTKLSNALDFNETPKLIAWAIIFVIYSHCGADLTCARYFSLMEGAVGDETRDLVVTSPVVRENGTSGFCFGDEPVFFLSKIRALRAVLACMHTRIWLVYLFNV